MTHCDRKRRKILLSMQHPLGNKAVSDRTTLHEVSVSRVLLLFFACALLLLTPSLGRAQVLYSTLLGTVTDSTGSTVLGATVVATNTETNISKTATTDNLGVYRFTDLVPGTYSVTISSKTFASVLSKGIALRANAELRFDAQLQPKTVDETITVTAAPAELQTDTATVAHDLEAKQLENLVATPGSGMRNFQSLYMVLPGFTPPSSSHSESGNPGDTMITNTNGISESNNNTRIDGVSDIYPWLPEIAAYAPSTEAIASVNVVTNSFNAEQGFAAGASINVTTKTGTNRYHGSAWEFNTISALEAKGYFVPTTTAIPKYVMNEFGANYGGPIKKNKLFFFGNWERARRSQAFNGYQTVPTGPMLTGDFSAISTIIYDPTTGTSSGTGRTQFSSGGVANKIPSGRISYAASQMAKLLAKETPNVNGAALSNNLYVAADGQYTRDNIDSRVDYNPNSKSTLFGRYGVQKTTLTDPQALGAAGGNTLDGGQPGNSTSIIQAIGIGTTYTFRSNLLLDANVGYLRQGMSAKDTDIGTDWGTSYFNIPGTNGSCSLCGGMPSFNFATISSMGNPNRSNPFQFRDNTYTTAGNITWVKGKHSTRYGMEFQRYALNHFQPQNTYGPRGGFYFNGGLTSLNGGTSPNGYNAWADFLLGIPQEIQKDTQYLNPATLRENIWAFYGQDQWQVTSKLTFNFGVRYEYYPIATRDHTGLDIFNPYDGYIYVGGVNGIPRSAGVSVGKGQLGPRAGLAYRFDSNTVIRAGFGLSTNPDNYRNVITSYPSVVSQTITGNTTYQPAYTESSGADATLNTDGIPALTAPNLSSGKAYLGSLGTPAGSLGATTLPMNYRRGYYESYNLAVERELPAAMTFQATYVGDIIIREIPGININAAQHPGDTQSLQPYTVAYGITASITSEIPMGTGHYNGLQAQLKHKFANGGNVAANYTYSRSINDYGDQSDGMSSLLVDALPYWRLNRAVAGFDRTHNLQVFGNYMLPFGKGQPFLTSGPVGYALGGWGLSGVMSRESGVPFTVTAGSNSLNAPGSTQFADQLVSKVQILGGHNSTHPYFNTANFVDPYTVEKAAAGGVVANIVDRFGTAGRNSVRGPGLFNLSTSVSRSFPITERFNLQFRGEAFNVTNTPSFSNPASSVTASSGFGVISSTANNNRELRFSVKAEF